MDKCKLTITRRCAGDDSNVNIEVRDTDAGVKFLSIKIDFEEFAKCLMGQAEMECLMKVNNLENVGKVIERDNLEFELPTVDYSKRKDFAASEAEKVCPEGWTPFNSFSSKDSFFTKDNKPHARTSIRRWVTKINQSGDK